MPDHLRASFDEAVEQWNEADNPDKFTFPVTAGPKNDPAAPKVIKIYHHETFPLGGRLYTMDSRSGEEYPYNLLHRTRTDCYGPPVEDKQDTE